MDVFGGSPFHPVKVLCSILPDDNDKHNATIIGSRLSSIVSNSFHILPNSDSPFYLMYAVGCTNTCNYTKMHNACRECTYIKETVINFNFVDTKSNMIETYYFKILKNDATLPYEQEREKVSRTSNIVSGMSCLESPKYVKLKECVTSTIDDIDSMCVDHEMNMRDFRYSVSFEQVDLIVINMENCNGKFSLTDISAKLLNNVFKLVSGTPTTISETEVWFNLGQKSISLRVRIGKANAKPRRIRRVRPPSPPIDYIQSRRRRMKRRGR